MRRLNAFVLRVKQTQQDNKIGSNKANKKDYKVCPTLDIYVGLTRCSFEATSPQSEAWAVANHSRNDRLPLCLFDTFFLTVTALLCKSNSSSLLQPLSPISFMPSSLMCSLYVCVCEEHHSLPLTFKLEMRC